MGSRQGADLEHLASFLNGLRHAAPDTVLVSGGADGVDANAESNWLSMGGRVLSYRPKKVADDEYRIELWDLGGEKSTVCELLAVPATQDYRGACFLRDMLIAEKCTRLVAFFRRGRSAGAAFTKAWAHDMGRPTFEYEAAAA